jgi:hypothetical protein
MVQDNYFLPDTPQNLAKKRPNIPVIIGTCKDEYAAWRKKNFFLKYANFIEIPNVIKDHNLTSYTRENIESNLTKQYATWFGNQSQSIIKIFEDNYLPPGTADDDHLA